MTAKCKDNSETTIELPVCVLNICALHDADADLENILKMRQFEEQTTEKNTHCYSAWHLIYLFTSAG